MKNTMSRAWEIRKAAAARFNVTITAVSMAECLKMAWEELRAEKAEIRTIVADYYKQLAGTGMAFSKSVLQATVENGVLSFDYAAPEFSEGKNSKILTATFEIASGAVISGKTVEIFGVDFDNIKAVCGKTYEIKEEIKKHGFKWNRNENAWTR